MRGKERKDNAHQLLSSYTTYIFLLLHSEKEALLLESTLIKRHRPRFNVMLKDTERSVLLRVARHHDYPRVEVARRRRDDDARYFGPYDSAGQLRRMLGVLERYFRLRTCQDAEFARRQRVCMEFEIGRCSGPCVVESARQEYADQVREVVWFLRGRTKPLIQSISSSSQACCGRLRQPSKPPGDKPPHCPPLKKPTEAWR